MPIAFPPYHVTMIVDDVEATMADLTRLFGLRWAALQFDGLFTYSLQGPPYIELLKRRDGTIFDTAGLHHVGLWVDDVNAEAARLEAEGCEPELVNRDDDGNVLPGCFFRTRDGMCVELVQIGTSGPRLLRMLAGGDYA